jgi:ATP phosphoribosyltransferase regulatory subunit
MDAHSLHHRGINRLCYANTVLHTSATNALASRSPLQIGAELYGHNGLDSDLEVISLMLESIAHLSIDAPLTLDLGHVGIYRSLLASMHLAASQEQTLFALLQAKATGDINHLVDSLDIASSHKTILLALVSLYGDERVLERAQTLFAHANEDALQAVMYLKALATAIKAHYPKVTMYFDLAELRGYQYHTGVVFAAFTPTFGQPITQGGRYDDIGRVFGCARPATGFSADLKALAALSSIGYPKETHVRVPRRMTMNAQQCQQLRQVEIALRQQGYRLVAELSGDVTVTTECQHYLEWCGDTWQLH